MRVIAYSTAFVAIVLVAGCSGGPTTSSSATVPSQSARQATRSTARGDLLARTLLVRPGAGALLAHGTPQIVRATKNFAGRAWVSDAGSNAVYDVIPAGKLRSVADPTGVGWSEPQGIAVDHSKHVYVADTANSRIVVLTKSGKLDEVLQDPGEYPAGVAVSPDGTAGVTNIVSVSGGPGSISIYAPGATSPTCTTSGELSQAYFIGADAEDNFYADGFNASTGEIEIAVISTSCAIHNTGIPTAELFFPGGVEVVAAGKKKSRIETLYVGDQSSFNVYSFLLPSYTPGTGLALSGGSDETEFNVDKPEKTVCASDAGLAVLNCWPWPAGGSEPSATVTGFSEPIGVAIDGTAPE